MDKKLLNQYVKDAKRCPPLSKKAEQAVIKKIREGDQRAMDLLIKSNLMFVVSVAYNYVRQGLDIEDLISAGNVGIIEAANRVKIGSDTKFISYAVWWIRTSIRVAIFREARNIRIPSNAEEKLRKIFRKSKPMKECMGGEKIDWDALIEREGIEEVRPVMRMQGLIEFNTSLDAPISEDGKVSVSDILPSHDPSPSDDVNMEQVKYYLENVLDCLDEKEKIVISGMFGLNDSPILTLRFLATKINLSRERVRQIKDVALHKLKIEINNKSIQKSGKRIVDFF